MSTALKVSALVVAVLAGCAVVQNAVGQQPSPPAGCEVAPPAKAPTPTEKGPDSGSKNMGSTGWSGGGTGGSHNETTAAGPLPGSKTEHPPTAKGLDLKKSDPKAC